jgi:hypothetical protein
MTKAQNSTPNARRLASTAKVQEAWGRRHVARCQAAARHLRLALLVALGAAINTLFMTHVYVSSENSSVSVKIGTFELSSRCGRYHNDHQAQDAGSASV